MSLKIAWKWKKLIGFILQKLLNFTSSPWILFKQVLESRGIPRVTITSQLFHERVVFSTLFSLFGYPDETVSFMFDILLHWLVVSSCIKIHTNMVYTDVRTFSFHGDSFPTEPQDYKFTDVIFFVLTWRMLRFTSEDFAKCNNRPVLLQTLLTVAAYICFMRTSW